MAGRPEIKNALEKLGYGLSFKGWCCRDVDKGRGNNVIKTTVGSMCKYK